MLNKSILIGRMTNDIELRQTQSSKTVGTFTVAVDDGYGDKKTTDFIRCVAWEKTAEFIHRNFGKGRMIVLAGKIKTRNWETDNGEKRSVTEVFVNEVDFAGEKKEEAAEPQEDNAQFEGFMPMDTDETLPF